MANDDDWRDQRRRELYGEPSLNTLSTEPSRAPTSPSRSEPGDETPRAATTMRPMRLGQRRPSIWPKFLAGAVLATAAVGGWLWYDRASIAPQVAETSLANTRALAASNAAQASCVLPETASGLRAIVFARARHIGGPNPAWLKAQAATSKLRIDDAYVKALDSTEGISICAGRLSLQLSGAPVLTGNVQYSVLPASDARGRVYTLEGADEIVRRLVELEPVDDAPPVPQAPIVPVPSAPTVAETPASTPQPVSVAARKPVPRIERAVRKAGRSPSAPPRSKAALVQATPSLVALDNTVNLLAAPAGAGTRLDRRIARGQAAFISRRDRCRSNDCIVRVYRARIDELARLRASKR